MFTIIRNNAFFNVELNDIAETDLILCADGRFYPAQKVPSLHSYLLHACHVQRRVAAREQNGWGAILLFVALGCWVLSDFNDPPRKPRRRWRPRNDEPLTASLRARVRERDKSICAYCGYHAPDGHVDHRVSRANGGSNHMNNLSWACARCNCSKGANNARQFMSCLLLDEGK